MRIDKSLLSRLALRSKHRSLRSRCSARSLRSRAAMRGEVLAIAMRDAEDRSAQALHSTAPSGNPLWGAPLGYVPFRARAPLQAVGRRLSAAPTLFIGYRDNMQRSGAGSQRYAGRLAPTR